MAKEDSFTLDDLFTAIVGAVVGAIIVLSSQATAEKNTGTLLTTVVLSMLGLIIVLFVFILLSRLLERR